MKNELYSHPRVPMIVVVVVVRMNTDLPLVAIDVPFGLDVVRMLHDTGGAIAVDLEQLHLAYGLREDSAAMFHGGGGGLKKGGLVGEGTRQRKTRAMACWCC